MLHACGRYRFLLVMYVCLFVYNVLGVQVHRERRGGGVSVWPLLSCYRGRWWLVIFEGDSIAEKASKKDVGAAIDFLEG